MSSTFILVGYSKDAMKGTRKNFTNVKKVGEIDSKYGMSYENQSIYLCTGLNIPMKETWLAGKSMNM